MITIKQSNNIFYNKKVIFNYFLTDDFVSDVGLKEIDWFEIKITGYDNDEIFNDFLASFVSNLKADFYVDFISHQRSDEVKNRIRNYAGYFYDLRKQHILNENYIAEKEIDTTANRSFFAGLLQVDNVDDEIIFDELLNNYNRIIHATAKQHQELTGERINNLISKIDMDLFRNNSLIEINYLTLLDRFLTDKSLIMSYLYNGRDDLICTIYSGQKISDNIKKIITKSIPSGQTIAKTLATSEDVDKLIASYFNDWRKVSI